MDHPGLYIDGISKQKHGMREFSQGFPGPMSLLLHIVDIREHAEGSAEGDEDAVSLGI